MGDDNDSDPVELGQNPSLSDSFEPISPAHERALETIDDVVRAFAEGDAYQPPSIRGPFRTGKTALEYHAYKKSWAHGVPAVYVEASTILTEFDASKSGSLESWVLERIREEIDAITSRNFDQVEWMPSGTESRADRQDWVEENIPTEVDTDRFVLIIDEVEQEYERFISATGVDDDNPLRKLLDKPELLPILSMGQLSAFEFIGDADLGRMEPIAIPPVTIDHVEELLEQQGADPMLGRVIYWLTRGRAARVHQLVTDVKKRELSPGDHRQLARWLSDQSHEQSTEFQPIRQLWEDPGIDDPDAAAGALTFDPDGRDDWIVDSDTWLPAAEVVSAIEEILIETAPFEASDVEQGTRREARRILRQAIRWVVHSIAAPPGTASDDSEARALPSTWLTGQHEDRSEAEALLSLVQDFLLAFEAERPARDLAFTAMEDAKASFKAKYDSKTACLAASEGSVWTVRPAVLEQAYPPLATDPSRITGYKKSTLEAEMDRGLRISVAEDATVVACPTQDAFEGQLQRLAPDPTHPTTVLVDDDVDVDAGLSTVPLAETLERYDALHIESVASARVWEFVVQLYGRLREDGHPYNATAERVAELAETASSREDRTTIDTLYTHLTSRVGAVAARTTVEAHQDQFDAGDGPLWAHSKLASEVWVNPGAEWGQGRHAVASLLALGAEPDWNAAGTLLNTIEEGLESDTIDTQTSKFKFKELLGHILDSGGYGSRIETPRKVYRQDSDSGPATVVNRVQGALEAAVDASEVDADAAVAQLFESQSDPGSGSSTDAATDLLESMDPINDDEYTTDVLWAVLTATLARKDCSYVVDCLDGVLADYTELVQTLKGYEADVEAAEAVLAPEGVPVGRTPDEELSRLNERLERHVGDDPAENTSAVPEDGDAIGVGVALDTSHIEAYRENLVSVRDALQAAKSAATDTADARPTAYALAVLASRYEYVVRDAVDELGRATPSGGTVSNVQNLRGEIRELLHEDSGPDISVLPAARTKAVKQFAENVLDLHSVVNTDTVAVGNPDGDGMALVKDIDQVAEQRWREVQRLEGELADLVDYHRTAAQHQENARKNLRSLIVLLDKPDETIPGGSQLERGGLSDELDAGYSPNTDSRTVPDEYVTTSEEATDD